MRIRDQFAPSGVWQFLVPVKDEFRLQPFLRRITSVDGWESIFMHGAYASLSAIMTLLTLGKLHGTSLATSFRGFCYQRPMRKPLHPADFPWNKKGGI
jgi:hypothetical protein